MNKHCKHCNNIIPLKRIELLPDTDTCVACSTVDKCSAVPVIHHKTGNEIQIVKDPEVAAEFHRLASRVGYGTLRGLKAGKSGGTDYKINITKRKIFIAHADEATFNKLGEKVMSTYDLLGKDKALKIIQDAVTSRLISSSQGAKLTKIIQAVSNNKPIETNQIKSRYLPNDTLKQIGRAHV